MARSSIPPKLDVQNTNGGRAYIDKFNLDRMYIKAAPTCVLYLSVHFADT